MPEGDAARPDTDYIPYDQKLILPWPYTTSNTKYNVYNASGSLLESNLTNPFYAIGRASATNSYVRETDGGASVDLRNGAYLKNVDLNKCKVYDDFNRRGSSYSFYGADDTVNFSFAYNDDVRTYAHSSGDLWETVNIGYDKNYNS
ncbi:MAG: hypothetical protein LBU36_00095 [Clostridiales bacterium]|nr:hypothetical protein [Clostridiales bacterium]